MHPLQDCPVFCAWGGSVGTKGQGHKHREQWNVLTASCSCHKKRPKSEAAMSPGLRDVGSVWGEVPSAPWGRWARWGKGHIWGKPQGWSFGNGNGYLTRSWWRYVINRKMLRCLHGRSIGQWWQRKMGKQKQWQQSDSCLKGSMGPAVVGWDHVTETWEDREGRDKCVHAGKHNPRCTNKGSRKKRISELFVGHIPKLQQTSF